MRHTGDDGDRFDLHTHSVCSDGHHAPSEVVAMAHAAGLAGVALTDHDTGEGIPEARAAGERLGIEVIPGIEFSAELDGRSVHVLGYWVAHDEPVLAAELARLRDTRADRARRMVERFNALGIPITYERYWRTRCGPARECLRRTGPLGSAH